MKSPRATLSFEAPLPWAGMVFSGGQKDLMVRALTTAFEKVVEETIHCYVLTDEQRKVIDAMGEHSLRFHADVRVDVVWDRELPPRSTNG